MGKRKTQAVPPKAAPPKPPAAWGWPSLLALAVLLFYWNQLTSPSASIQWDAADLHYPLQKYFSDHLRAGKLPFWTPYLFSGYPFLANPEVGAWYLPHWLLFLLGVTPRAIQLELALNAYLACLGTFLFLWDWLKNRPAAFLGAFAYGLSGFFAGNSSHIGLFCAAAGLPWLLLAYRKALEQTSIRYTALGALAGSAMILAGYVQTAMYSFLALGLCALVDIALTPKRAVKVISIVSGMLVLSLAIASIQILPGLELTKHSIRAGFDYGQSRDGVLQALPLLTLAIPNALGAITGPYTGPVDITQYYFYAGILVLPLAAFGWKNRSLLWRALALIIPSIWYMLGPAGGLYRIGALIPGLHRVRAPIQGWFIPAFGLAILAAAGLAFIQSRWQIPYLAPVLVLILFGDVWYWNSWTNPMAYLRASFDEAYGAKEDLARRQIALVQPPLSRFDAPRNLAALGPLDDPLNLPLETTYGYFALEPAAYDDYTNAMRNNLKLRDGLNVSRFLNISRGSVDANPGVLPRAYFPKAVQSVASEAESRNALASLDPSVKSIVLGLPADIHQGSAATASVANVEDSRYRIHYKAASNSLLRLAVPWYPGWTASAGGREIPVLRVDHALMGAVVPAGENDVEFRFHSTYFGLGAGISIAGLLVACAFAFWYKPR